MKRRDFIKTSALTSLLLISCNNNQRTGYTHYLESEIGNIISLEGEIIHVCPVEGLKMKLRLSDGEIICVSHSKNIPFSKQQWEKKKVRINGKLTDTKLPAKLITSNYNEKKLLCHIDYSPCIDTKWIENRWQDGSAERILDRENENLQKKMHNTKRNFVQVFTITADNINEL